MSFREKSAWVTLTAILLVFVLYVLHAPNLSKPGLWEIHMLLACIVAFVWIELVAFVTAEVVNYGARIYYYRRGA